MSIEFFKLETEASINSFYSINEVDIREVSLGMRIANVKTVDVKRDAITHKISFGSISSMEYNRPEIVIIVGNPNHNLFKMRYRRRNIKPLYEEKKLSD